MSTNKGPITVITTTVAVMAFMCVFTCCLLSYLHIEITKDLSMITTGLVGALTGMLVKTSPTEATTQPPTPTLDNPMPVKPITSVTDPVHTEEAQP